MNLLKDNVFKLYLKYFIPTIGAALSSAIYILFDTIFIGQGVGGDGLAALNIAIPIFGFYSGTGLLIGIGGSTLLSIERGRGHEKRSNKIFTLSIIMGSVISILYMILGLLFIDKVAYFLGATEYILPLVKEYLFIIMIGTVSFVMVNVLSPFIRADKAPKTAMAAVIIGGFTNIALDYIFVFPLNMGMKGIALSTLVSEIFYFGFSTIFLIKKKLWFRRSHGNFAESKEILISIVKIGFVQFLMQSLNSVSAFIINKVLIFYGSVSYVGAWSICSNMNMVILLPLIGLTQGVQSIVAYFHSSQNKSKERRVKNKVLQYSLIYSITVTLIVFIFTAEVLRIFTNDMDLLKVTIPIMKIVVVGFPFLGLLYAVITFMQVSGKEDDATKLELMRQIVLSMPLVIILPRIFLRYNIFNISPQLSVFLAVPLSTFLLLFAILF